jgi:colanic acid/amylovoran biosynthesis glycosyltransferase
MPEPRTLSVLYVAWAYPKLSETFVQKEIELMRSRGHDVRVLAVRRTCAGHPTDKEALYLAPQAMQVLASIPKVFRPTTRFANRIPEDLACRLIAQIAAQQLHGWSPDVVHAHFMDRPSTVALHLSNLLGTPTTVTAHARDWTVHSTAESLRAKGRASAHIFAISEQAVHGLSRKASISSDKISVCRASFSASDPGPPREIVSNTVIAVARLVPKKGLDVLLDAMPHVIASRVGTRLIVVGDGPERARLDARARLLGISESVMFLGAQSNPNVLAILASGTVFALPCRELPDGDADGIPVVMMEAGALGLPIISTPVGGVAELVQQGVTGLLVPQDDPAALASALLRLLSNDDLRVDLAKSMKRHLRQEFDPALQASRLESVWGSLARA